MKAARLRSPSLSRLAAVCLGAGSLALSACGTGSPGSTTISYRQVGACVGYDAAGGRVSARQNEAFVIFKIEAVDDTQAGIDFTFVPSRLYVDQSTEKQKAEWIGNLIHRTVSNDPRFSQSMGVSGVAAALVPPGKKIEPNAYAVVAVATSTPNGAEEANRTSYDLLYEAQIIGGERDPAIHLTKTNAAQTTWPQTDDCKAIKLQ
jgi:hypothetical protein